MPAHSFIFGTNSEKVMYTDYPFYWFAYYEGDPRTCIGVAIKPKINIVTNYNLQFYRARGSIFNEWWNKRDGHDLAPNKIYFFNQYLLHEAPSGAYNNYDARGNVRDDSERYIEQGGSTGVWYYVTTFQDGTANEVGVDTNMPLCESVTDIQSVYESGIIPPKFEFKADWYITKIGTQNIETHTICDMSSILEDEESPYFEKGNQIKFSYNVTYFSHAGEENITLYDYGTRVDKTYQDLIGLIDLDFIDKIIQGIGSLINGGNIKVELKANLFSETEPLLQSGGAYFIIDNNSLEVYVNEGSSDTITIITEDEEENIDDDIKGDDTPTDDNTQPSGSDILTTTYAITRNVAKNIGQQLWGSSFIDNIHLVNNSPIENIVSVKMYPFDIQGGESKEIHLGNVAMGQNGNVVINSHKRFNEVTVYVKENKNIPTFLNYGNNTVVQIYLPCIGLQSLDTNLVMGRTLFLSTVVDLITGACEYTLKAVYDDDKVPIGVYRCNVGEEIPVTASNRASVEVGYITSAIGTVADISSGNYVGALTNTISGITQGYHSNTQGTVSPSVSMQGYLQPFIIVEYPKTNIDTQNEFKNTYGYMVNAKKQLRTLQGFTQIEKPHLTTLSCSQQEKEELINIMRNGFYI